MRGANTTAVSASTEKVGISGHSHGSEILSNFKNISEFPAFEKNIAFTVSTFNNLCNSMRFPNLHYFKTIDIYNGKSL